MFRKSFIAIVFLSFCSAISIAADVPFEATDIDGNSFFGTVVSMAPEKIVFNTDDGEKSFSVEQLARLQNLLKNPLLPQDVPGTESDIPGSPRAYPIRTLRNVRINRNLYQSNQIGGIVGKILRQKELESKNKPKVAYPDSVFVLDLLDGSRLVALQWTLKGKTATLKPFSGDELTLSLDQIASIRFDVKSYLDVLNPPPDWTKTAGASTEKGDRLVVGQAGSLDSHDGIVVEVSPETVTFSVDGEKLPVPRRKVFGLVLHQDSAAKTVKPLLGRLVVRDGSMASLQEFRTTNDGTLAWTSAGGFAGTTKLENIELLEFVSQNAVFLIDMTPDDIRQSLPFVWEKDEPEADSPLALLRSFQTNRMLRKTNSPPPETNDETLLLKRPTTGDSRQARIPELPIPGLQGILLDGVYYEKGLSMPSGTTIEYKLQEPFAMLRGRIGIDDRSRPDGACKLRILADDKLICELLVRGDESSRVIQHAIPAGARNLLISVLLPDGSTDPATLNLVEMKLMK